MGMEQEPEQKGGGRGEIATYIFGGPPPDVTRCWYPQLEKSNKTMIKHNSRGRFIFGGWFWSSDFVSWIWGFWIWRFGQKTIEKKKKKGRKVHCLRRADSILPQGKDFVGETLVILFVFWDVMGNPMHVYISWFGFHFLHGLGAWGRAKLHFWSSNPLQAGKCTLQGCGFHFPVISQWFGCLGRVNLHFWRSNPLQENVHFKVVGFIFLWFLNGLGVWGRVNLHFWRSNPLQENVHCRFHFPLIPQWFGCLGQGQVTFLKF